MNNFVEWLKNRLQQDLPGDVAQYKMAPKLRQSSSHYLQNNPNHKTGAVNILLYAKQDKMHTVLTLRNSYNGAHSSQVSFPGGKLEQSEDIVTAAIRETFEEIGIEQQHMQHIGNLSHLYIPASNFLVHPIITVLTDIPSFKPDVREVNKIIEFPLQNLFNEAIKKETVINTSYGLKIPAPYYEIDEQVVWGATAMILSEFEQLLLPYKNNL